MAGIGMINQQLTQQGVQSLLSRASEVQGMRRVAIRVTTISQQDRIQQVKTEDRLLRSRSR